MAILSHSGKPVFLTCEDKKYNLRDGGRYNIIICYLSHTNKLFLDQYIILDDIRDHRSC